MPNTIKLSEVTNWSEYFDSWVDGNLPKESVSDCILRLSKQISKLEYELTRTKDTIQNLNEEVESLDEENSRLTKSMQMMEKI